MKLKNNLIKQLKSKGLSKWKISKLLGVSWQTVYMWDKDVFKPNKEHLEKLEEILNKEVSDEV